MSNSFQALVIFGVSFIVVRLSLLPSNGPTSFCVPYHTHARTRSYNEKKDVERLLLKGQLMSKTRNKRAARPVARYQPPIQPLKPKPLKVKAPVDEEKRRRRKKRLRRARRKRRALKRRKRELAMKYLSAIDDTSCDIGV